MRIIAGKAKGRKLKSINNPEVRPTSDRVKEAIFNMLGPVIRNCVILDLFAGFGSLGLEALSRGAKRAIFVEKSKKNSSVINENLNLCNFSEYGIVKNNDVFDYLSKVKNKFDIIFMDPPYDQGLVKESLVNILDNNTVFSDSLIVAELSREVDIELPPGLITIKHKIYGDTKVEFYRQEEN